MAPNNHDNVAQFAGLTGMTAVAPNFEHGPTLAPGLKRLVRALESAFQQSFHVVDPASGKVVQPAADGLQVDLYSWLPLCEEVARNASPEVIADVAPLLMLAVPLPVGEHDPDLVAVSTFVTSPVEREADVRAAAEEFGVQAELVAGWAKERMCWHPHGVMQLSSTVLEKARLQHEATQLEAHVADVSSHLLNTFEEITLLHRLTQRLSISRGVVELCELSVKWLMEVVPAECIAIKLDAVEDICEQHELNEQTEPKPVLITFGQLPIDESEFDSFVDSLGPQVDSEPIVINRAGTVQPTWEFPAVRDVISVPFREGDNLFGWLVAMNHTGNVTTPNSEVEFGTVEASLMSSVAAILGIHAGNIALYRQQAEFFASVVRALTSAIDAKDPYTCGHSDRVARLAVCLARRMGCGQDELNTVYLSGLLHDIGKIGISDAVLSKPGPLTFEELEHIKTHPELGYKILHGVKQLDNVLPIVLHHHEAWDGSGYPAGLKTEDTPRLARIVAVADSIDAMSSDRPYRKGIPDERLDEILRHGAGSQWDPQVINAVFQVRDEIRRIGQNERQPLSLDVEKWQPPVPTA